MKEMRELMDAIEAIQKLDEPESELLDETVDPISNRDGYTVEIRDIDVDEGDPDQYVVDSTNYKLDILLDGQVVGELRIPGMSNSVYGTLHNKDLPNLSGYWEGADFDDRFGGYDPDDEDAEHNYRAQKALAQLKRFLSTKTGVRWAANIDKYQ